MPDTKTSLQEAGQKLLTGSLFDTRCSVVVNTVNCKGAMGAGVALEARLRHPKMYEEYLQLCRNGAIQIGKLWLYRDGSCNILNFPTKNDWRNPTKEEYLHSGLQRFMETYKSEGITSVAFPILGAANGGIKPARSLEIMRQYLDDCDIPVEIYEFAPRVSNRLFLAFKMAFTSGAVVELANSCHISVEGVSAIKRALDSGTVFQFEGLTKAPGVTVKLTEAALAPFRSIPLDAAGPRFSQLF